MRKSRTKKAVIIINSYQKAGLLEERNKGIKLAILRQTSRASISIAQGTANDKCFQLY